MCRKKMMGLSRKKLLITLVIVVLVLQEMMVQAQGVKGIEKAESEVKTYFGAGEKLMYVIGAVVGLVGAIKVYQKWNSGDQDTSKVAASWFGSCIFLVVVATVLKSFFGL